MKTTTPLLNANEVQPIFNQIVRFLNMGKCSVEEHRTDEIECHIISFQSYRVIVGARFPVGQKLVVDKNFRLAISPTYANNVQIFRDDTLIYDGTDFRFKLNKRQVRTQLRNFKAA